MDIKRLLLGSTLIQRFIENFTTEYTTYTANTWIPNAFNNWDWYGTGISTWSSARVASGKLNCNAGGVSNSAKANLLRNKENYNINKSYDISFSFFIDGTSGGFPALFRLSIGGTTSAVVTDSTLYGLEFRVDVSSGNSFRIYNNGTLLATPYSTITSGVTYYVFIKKRGLNISVTLNTTGTAPTSYDFTYTMNDTTALSSSLHCLAYAQGFGETGWSGIDVDNLNVLVIG